MPTCTAFNSDRAKHAETANFETAQKSSKDYIYNITKTSWRDAQRFCRDHHTDLTSVRDKTENEQIQTIINNNDDDNKNNINTNDNNNNNNNNKVWIGLFSDSWEWSDKSDSTFRYWKSGEPNGNNSEPCTEVLINTEGRWNDQSCSTSRTFVCHEDHLILIKKTMSWSEALVYCRQHHVDLVSVVSEKIQRWLKEVIVSASTASVWMGLRHSCSVGIWFWVNGEPVCYQNWAPGNGTSVEDCDPKVRSGAVQRDGDHQWISRPDTDKLNFICIKHD
ncbi:C-type mannose receptor 2-like [Misgurnus anguillicaudatus]|uniref:C-type mannose receptor 2-like n=1 Tax=Misgurnus anguillicaudatus TaxID=75329 RepID=UPI003CCF71EC